MNFVALKSAVNMFINVGVFGVGRSLYQCAKLERGI